MTKIFYGMMYPSGDLAAIDYSSGGYPYSANRTPQLWERKEDAQRYVRYHSSFNLKLVKITMQIEEEET